MIPTTVIGSYPVRLDGTEYAKAYFGEVEVHAVEDAIEQAVEKQVDAGIDIVSDGQTRGNFVNIYARNFRGVVIQDRPVVLDEMEYMGPSTVDDQMRARELLPDGVQLKGIITGPYTMAKNSVDRHYGSVEELAYAYADGLAVEAEALDDIVDYVQVDEPFFSVDYPEYGGELLEKVLGGVKKPRMLHVCGDVSHVFGKFTEFNVDVLEHEFAANPQLWDTVKEVDFDQKLGVGVVRSDLNDVESVEEIEARMKNAVDHVDADKLLFNPDCGLRNLSPEAAFNKLKNMVAARDDIGR